MTIVVDASTSTQGQGTGLAVHSRLLVEALASLGVGVEVLYGAPRRGPSTLPAEVAIADVPAPRSRSRYQRLLALVPTVEPPRSRRWPARAQRVELGRVVDLVDSHLPSGQGHALYLENGWQRAWAHFIAYRRLLPIQVPNDVNAVHWSSPLPMYALGARNVYTILDLIPITMPYATTDHVGLHWRLVEQVLERADLVTVPSHATLADLDRIFPFRRPPIEVVPLGIQPPPPDGPEATRVILERVFDLRPQHFFLAVGELQPRKNYARLLDAYLTSGTDLPLVIAGPPGWRYEQELATLERLAKRSPAEAGPSDVRYLGYVPSEHLDALLRSARALLFPSLAEGFGLPIVEAFARSTPVLTAEGGATEEVAGSAALLVDPRSVNAIRDGIVRLAEDDALCKTLSVAGLQRAEDFSLSSFAQRLLAAYRKGGIEA